MAESLEAFLTRQLREVAPDGRSTRRIALVPLDDSGDELDPYETFESPLRTEEGGMGPRALAETIEELCQAYAEEFPKGSLVTVAVISEDADGGRLGKHHKRVHGQNTAAKRTPGGPAAVTDGVHALVRAMKEIVAVQNGQISQLVAHNKILMEERGVALQEHKQAMAEVVLATGMKQEAAGEAVKVLKEATPKILGLVQMFLQMSAGNKGTPPPTTTEGT